MSEGRGMGKQARMRKERRQQQTAVIDNINGQSEQQLRAEIRRQRIEIERLQSDLRIAQVGMNSMLQKAREERDYYIEAVIDLEQKVAELIEKGKRIQRVWPPEILHDDAPVTYPHASLFKPSNIQQDTTQPVTVCGLVLMFRQRGTEQMRTISSATELPGTLTEAMEKTIAPVSLVFSSTPTLNDIGNQNVPGITQHQLWLMLMELSRYRKQSDQAFIQRRRELFEEVWDHVSRTNFDISREGLLDRFDKAINRTFEKMDKRLANLRLESATEFIAEIETPRQKLS